MGHYSVFQYTHNGNQRQKGAERISEEIMTEKFPNINDKKIKIHINLKIQELNHLKYNEFKEIHTQTHDSQNVKRQRQEIILKIAIKNRPMMYKESSIRLKADFRNYGGQIALR